MVGFEELWQKFQEIDKKQAKEGKKKRKFKTISNNEVLDVIDENEYEDLRGYCSIEESSMEY